MFAIFIELAYDMYSFIGLHAVQLMEDGSIDKLSYEILSKLLSGDYYIDLPEEMVLGLLVDWVNCDFEVCQSIWNVRWTVILTLFNVTLL